MTDYLQICLDLICSYKDKVKKSLLKQGIANDKAEEITEALDLDRELIFSLNRTYEKALTLDELCSELRLHSELPELFKMRWKLYSHQVEAIRSIHNEICTVISSGTGSGKTESFLIPIVNYCIDNEMNGLKAIIIYPMNALAGDQLRRFREVLSGTKITYAIFNGETPDNSNEEVANSEYSNELVTRSDIINYPPDILVTNYVMLDRIMTNPKYSKLIDLSADTLKYAVLDEIHTYRGNKGLHIRGLIGRLKSKINSRLVLIGCSATLRNKGMVTDGYISIDRDTYIESFIKRLFWLNDNDPYNYIEPIYDTSKKSLSNPVPPEYLSIRDSKMTESINNILEAGPASLHEIFDSLLNKSLVDDKKTLIEYFTKVMNVNLKYPDIDPVLDFRVHIFMLKISGILSRCVECGKYYSGGIISTCIDCGGPTLPVDKLNQDLLIGILNNGEILNPLIDSQIYKSDDPIVFLNFIPGNYEAIEEDSYRIGRLSQGERGLKINADKDGRLELILAKNIKVVELEDHYINFEECGKEEYISYIIKELMLRLNGQDKKLLSFIDNREKVGRYDVLIGDALLSDFFYETLKYINQRNISILDLRIEWINALKEAVGNNQNLDIEQKRLLLNDAELWFVRFLKLGKDGRKILLCNENLYSNLNPCETEILRIAIEESCFDYDIRNIIGDVIKVDRIYFEHSRGIGLQSNDAKSISLSDSGIKYKNIITRYTLEAREKALKHLVEIGFLKKSQRGNIVVDPASAIYYLNESKLKIATEKSSKNNLLEIIDNEVLFADAHSSEIPKHKRKEVESKLQHAQTNVVFATPTLEMGIDIGELTFIMMIGVPPAPSNYAQRVGRAGRRKSRFAASIAICSPMSSHDWYYYHDPKAMVDGMISPPKFDNSNKNIIKKHITATLPIDTINAIKSNHRNNINSSLIKKHYIDKLDSEISVIEFLKNLQDKLERLPFKDLSINTLYDKGILPDYGFSKDEINYIDIENGEVIASRSVDLAFREVVPGKREFIGESYYEFLEVNNKSFDTYEGNNVIEVNNVYCQRKDHIITKGYERKTSESFVISNPDSSPEKKISKGPLQINLLKDTELHLININKAQRLGYRLHRDVIKFELDRRVVTDNQYYSLIAALDRGLKDYCGLDESELTWILNHDIRIVNSINEEKWYALLYEKSGTGDIDFESIIDDIGKWNCSNILQSTFSQIRNCSCDKETGCYLCMRSYATQRFISFAQKKVAENFIGYLIGERRFNASPKWESRTLKYDNVISLSKKGDKFIIEDEFNNKVCQIKEKENYDIMKELTLLLVELYKNQDVETIKFIVRQEHILNAINEECNLKDSQPWFNKFKFYKAAFREILAEKG